MLKTKVHHPAKVRAARARLLPKDARQLMDQVRNVLCEPTRTQIVRALGAGPLSVTDLASALGRSRSAISQHLKVLREQNIVQVNRRGRVAYYALTNTPVTSSATQAIELVVEAAPCNGEQSSSR